MILVLDFGSQYTQLIAKAFRSLGFACEVRSAKSTAADIKSSKAKAVVLSGSPLSAGGEIEPDPEILSLDLPVLAICFGYHFLAKHFGGEISAQSSREYGHAKVSRLEKKDLLLEGLPSDFAVWMSHGDSVSRLPEGSVKLLESGGEIAAFSMPEKKIWAIQFHPEVAHTENGSKLLENFAGRVSGIKPDWDVGDALGDLRAKLKKQLAGIEKVYCAVSGGVDSTVLAQLLSEFCEVEAMFVDHGFLRSYDWSDLQKVFTKNPKVHLHKLDAQEMFWSELDGVSDPEDRRKIIGKLFIEAFYGHLPQGEEILLGQGTIYSDVIESAANDLGPAHKIKSHHNVGGLPENLKFKLIEPLRDFFKDEVREIGKLLGIDKAFLQRHPFPGPGLALRSMGPLKREDIDLLRRCDEIFHDELVQRNLYEKTWQALVVLLPVESVGVMGDSRSFEKTLVIRCVNSREAMTADATEFEWSEIKAIASKLVNKVPGINRVVYDLTSKPPGTIEWQ